MLDRKCLIRQPAGLGDIIFCQKIADMFIENGYKVWWPVIDEYYDAVVKHMSKNKIQYCKQSAAFPLKEYFFSSSKKPIRKANTEHIYVPLQLADLNYPGESIMYSKYKLLGMDFSDWKEHVSIERDVQRENHIYHDVLGLTDCSEYCLVNRFFGSPPTVLERKEMSLPKMQTVEMKMLGFDTIFDWCKVIENAKEIHTVETVFCYLMEKLKLKSEKRVMYTRNRPERGFDYIKKIYSHDWNYVL